jgi:hypothetical protein
MRVMHHTRLLVGLRNRDPHTQQHQRVNHGQRDVIRMGAGRTLGKRIFDEKG